VVSDRARGFSFCVAGREVGDLNRSLRRWLEETYHQRVHSVTTQKPLERFSSHLSVCGGPAEPGRLFSQAGSSERAKDRSVALNGRLYEAPLCLLANGWSFGITIMTRRGSRSFGRPLLRLSGSFGRAGQLPGAPG